MYKGEREAEMKSALYHAVSRGDIEGAQEEMRLMMMAGIDDFAIIKANKAFRPLPENPVNAVPLPSGKPGTFMASIYPEGKGRR